MSMKKAGITIFSLLIMLIIILLTVRGCSISKKSEQKEVENSQAEVVLQEKNSSTEKENIEEDEEDKVSEDSKNTSSNTSKNGIEEDENADVGSSAENLEASVSQNTDGVSSNSNNSSAVSGVTDNTFIEIGEPVLGESITVNALVSSKKSYLVDGKSYAYSIGVLLPNENGYEIVNYYCPKKTYDAVSSGESIKVDYQVDEKGKVSINSISK